MSVVLYVGTKDQRTRIFTQDVMSLKFNVLVTTYEFIMRDRSKLSKVRHLPLPTEVLIIRCSNCAFLRLPGLMSVTGCFELGLLKRQVRGR